MRTYLMLLFAFIMTASLNKATSEEAVASKLATDIIGIFEKNLQDDPGMKIEIRDSLAKNGIVNLIFPIPAEINSLLSEEDKNAAQNILPVALRSVDIWNRRAHQAQIQRLICEMFLHHKLLVYAFGEEQGHNYWLDLVPDMLKKQKLNYNARKYCVLRDIIVHLYPEDPIEPFIELLNKVVILKDGSFKDKMEMVIDMFNDEKRSYPKHQINRSILSHLVFYTRLIGLIQVGEVDYAQRYNSYWHLLVQNSLTACKAHSVVHTCFYLLCHNDLLAAGIRYGANNTEDRVLPPKYTLDTREFEYVTDDGELISYKDGMLDIQ